MRATDGAATFHKGLKVLNCFETGRDAMSMADVARATGLDRATTRRLCLTLIEAGYLTKTGKSLHLTPRILAMAGGYLRAHDVGLAIQPVLNRFAAELGGEITLCMRDGDRAIYVAHAAAAKARVSIGFTLGSQLPLLTTATGRMLLALAPPDDEDPLYDTPPLAHTEHTDTDIPSIRARIATARRTGYALVREEFERGASALAVPLGFLGGCAAVLTTSATVRKLGDPAQFEHALDVLRRTALTLARHRAVDPPDAHAA